MSKKTKGKKLDPALFFTSTTSIDDISVSRETSRPDGRSVADGGRSNGDWRGRETSKGPPVVPNIDPTDKWGSIFSRSKTSENGWRPTSHTTHIKAESASAVLSQPAKPNLEIASVPVTSNIPQAIGKKDQVETKNQVNDLSKKPTVLKSHKSEAAQKMKTAKEAILAKAGVATSAKIETDDDKSFLDSAKHLISTGTKGEALLAAIVALPDKITGSALIRSILSTAVDPLSLKWCTKSEYGLALDYLLKKDSSSQLRSLLTVQDHCNKLKFPKIEIKGNARNLIEVIFQLMYQNDLVDAPVFLSWADEHSDTPGKTTAIVQTTPFLQFLREEDSADEHDEDEEEIDAPMSTAP